MTTATPKQTPQAQQPAQKKAGAAAPVADKKPKLTPEQRLQRIIAPTVKPQADKGQDILADGKKKPKAQSKDASKAKPATQPKKAQKAAPQGQADDADDVLG